uniref:C1q domain-containing protein n=1 Tax=viral metagenome TaxID=1070528 RepID=A0A6C0C2U1_9ZZZZ
MTTTCNKRKKSDYAHTCTSLSALTRALGKRNLEIGTGESLTIPFDRHVTEIETDPRIAYNRGAFCLCEPGLYHFDLAVCFIVDKSLGEDLGKDGSNVSVGMVSLRHEERFVYARLQASQASAARASANFTVMFSGNIHVCAQQIVSFVVSFSDPLTKHIKIRAADFNPDQLRECTSVSIYQVCRDGPKCLIAPSEDRNLEDDCDSLWS